MAKKVKIFLIQFNNTISEGETKEQTEAKKTEIEEAVNAYLELHEGAKVKWLQSSGAGKITGSYTQLTAIVSYDD